jgi:photosystem II stability/assembly factor-like uncharacterized protein
MSISCRVALPSAISLTISLTAALALSPVATHGQRAAATSPSVKGVWEPVSFGEDIDLKAVVFVTADVGWAAGDKGTIIHTKDAGAHWEAQLGGEPESADEPVKMLRFADEYHGWALKGRTLLRTVDGTSWEELGALPFDLAELSFQSPNDGVAAGTTGVGVSAHQLYRTSDGGRSWKRVGVCGLKATLGGMTRNVGCQVIRFHFPTASTGYFVAHTMCVGVGCDGPPIVGKTDDGGEHWTVGIGPGDPTLVGARDLYFVDERTGFVVGTDDKLYTTADGGETWKGVVATIAHRDALGFADPEVGWAFEEYKLSYTIDGGRRWSSRPHQFPTHPRAWSFPRRDRAYVVGDNGMVFRYGVMRAGAPIPASAIAAPAMPAIASTLDDEVETIGATVTELGAALGTGASSTTGPRVDKLGLALTAIATSLPSFLERYRNTNLLGAGLRMVTDLPAKYEDLRRAVTAFKGAQDKAAAEAALGQVSAAAQALQQATRTAFQRELPPAPSGS